MSEGEAKSPEEITQERVDKLTNEGVCLEDDFSREDILPEALCRKFSITLDWRRCTGFDRDRLQSILERALPYIHKGRAGKLSRTEMLFLSIYWLRYANSATAISQKLGHTSQTITRSILKGLKALGKCFKEFAPEGGLPRLGTISNDEALGLPEEALDSIGVVDGKHVPATRLGTYENAASYYSHKLNRMALQFQAVVSHLGQCFFVTHPERAAVHDITIYKGNREKLIIGLQSMGIKDPKILADKGYRAIDCPELVVPKVSNPLVNKHRLLVENYFGRMTAKFLAVTKKFPFSPDAIDSCIRATCFLTNESILDQPLRYNEYKYYTSVIKENLMKDEKKKEKHRRSVADSRKRAALKKDVSQMSQSFSSPSSIDFDMPFPKLPPQ